MSVAGTKNFDQPPHDSNRTHLVFSTSGLLLGSRAPLVYFEVSFTWSMFANDSIHYHPTWVPSWKVLLIEFSFEQGPCLIVRDRVSRWVQ